MANPSGRRSDGTHWQEEKDFCAHGHDIRPQVDGQPNPNVYYHHRSNCRQCRQCSQDRASVCGRLSYARRKLQAHQAACSKCSNGGTCAIAQMLYQAAARHASERGRRFPKRRKTRAAGTREGTTVY